MSELRHRDSDRGQEQPAAQTRPDAGQRGRRGIATSGAERLRMLYGSPPPVSQRGSIPRRGDALRNRAAGAGDTGHRTGPARVGRARLSRGPDARLTSKSDSERDRRDREDDRGRGDPDAIDPRLLAGVPRPRGALPDDTGRAYLTRPREAPAGAGQDGSTDTARPAGKDRPDSRGQRSRGDRGDRLHVWVDRPAFQDRFDDEIPPPDRYGDPLTLPDGSRIPRFNDRPAREQTRQGGLGDCGVIATLGAVASHRPGDMAHRVAIQADGTYRVRLSEARWTRNGDGAKPTGRVIELTVTPDLPVYDDEDGVPAFAQAEGGAAWSPIVEKAVAGVDKSWTASRRAEWEDTWTALCEQDAADKELKNPRSGSPPDGYVRLNQGSNAWQRAELLTQLTGKESIVRQLPRRADDVTRMLARQLDDHKPVLIATREAKYEGEELPHDLEGAHVYEVTAIRNGKIILRNPWNHTHPEPMKPDEFAANVEPNYTTLK